MATVEEAGFLLERVYRERVYWDAGTIAWAGNRDAIERLGRRHRRWRQTDRVGDRRFGEFR
jgi:hypothetical protein